MALTLSIRFSGLFTLFRGTLRDPGAPRADVLLVDSRQWRPDGTADAHLPQALPRHTPFLTLPSELVDWSASAPALAIVGRPGGGYLAFWELGRERVRLVGTDPGKGVTSPKPPSTIHPKPGPGQSKHLDWVPSLARIAAKHKYGGVDPVNVDPSRTPTPFVAARVELREGELRTAALFKKGSGYRVFQFTTPDSNVVSPVSSALAASLLWTVTSKAGRIDLLLESFDSAASRTIVLSAQGTAKAEGSVTNEAVPDGSAGARSFHYIALYDLLRNRPSDAARLLPQSTSTSQPSALNAGGTDCPPDQLP